MKIINVAPDTQFVMDDNVYIVVAKGKHGGGKMEISNVYTDESIFVSAMTEVELFNVNSDYFKKSDISTSNKKEFEVTIDDKENVDLEYNDEDETESEL